MKQHDLKTIKKKRSDWMSHTLCCYILTPVTTLRFSSILEMISTRYLLQGLDSEAKIDKGIVHPQMEKSSFTHPLLVPNPSWVVLKMYRRNL